MRRGGEGREEGREEGRVEGREEGRECHTNEGNTQGYYVVEARFSD